MKNKDININFFLLAFPRQVVEMSNDEVLVNINTREDYEKYILEREAV